jgi:hypothetical protein
MVSKFNIVLTLAAIALLAACDLPPQTASCQRNAGPQSGSEVAIAAPSAAITTAHVTVANECGNPVEYCVEDGTTLNTSLGPSSFTSHTVSPGARFRLRSGGNCGQTVLVAAAIEQEQRVVICSR